MNKVVSLFDNVIKIIGASYLFLTIAGFIDLKLYYSKFGIAINEYITVSEILFAALDKILFVLLILLLQLAFWLYLFRHLFEYDLNESLQDGEKRPKKHHDETIHRSFKSKHLLTFWLIIIFGTIVSMILGIIYPKSKFLISVRDFFMLNYWMAICLYMVWLQATRRLWEAMKKESNTKIVITLIVFFSVLILSIWVKNLFHFNRIRKYGNNKTTELILNDNSRIISTDTIRFVGHTENYFYYWNKLTGQSTIYPVGDVKQIILK